MFRPAPILAVLTTALFVLSGCFGGDGGSDGGDGTPSPSPTGSTTRTTTPTPTPSPTPAPQVPIYINGTVQGAYDCSNPGQLPPVGLSTQDVPMAAWNRTYTLTLTGGTQPPAGAQICLVWDTGETGNTGTVPSGATKVTVGADLTYAGAYSIKID